MIHSGELRSGKGSHDENFPVASRLIKRQHRPAILAFYEFVRVADDIADHPRTYERRKNRPARSSRIQPCSAAVAMSRRDCACAQSCNDRGLSTRHAQDLLSAFRQDATKHRYANWEELIDYCSRSAMPVGRFVLDVHGETRDTWPASDALCAALQIINHLQDCAKDYQALDRVYIPLDAMSASGASVEVLKDGSGKSSLAGLPAWVGRRARRSYWTRAAALRQRSGDTRLALEISVIQSLASQLLAILMVRDPLVDRVHLTKAEALAAAANGGGRAILRRLLRTMAPAQRFQTP